MLAERLSLALFEQAGRDVVTLMARKQRGPLDVISERARQAAATPRTVITLFRQEPNKLQETADKLRGDLRPLMGRYKRRRAVPHTHERSGFSRLIHVDAIRREQQATSPPPKCWKT